MLRAVCVCFLFLSSGLYYRQDQKVTPRADRQQQIIELSKRRFQAFFEGDKATYERLLGNDAVFVYSNGRVLDRGQALAELTPLAKPGTFTFSYQDVQFRDLGNTVVLVYRLVFRGPSEIGDYVGMTSDVWVWRNDAWQLVALHGTTVPYPDRNHVVVDPTLLDEYVGRYVTSPGVYYDISRQGSELMGQRSGFPKVPWLAESESSFYVASDPSATRIFLRDAKGRVSKLIRIEAAGNSVWTKVRPGNNGCCDNIRR